MSERTPFGEQMHLYRYEHGMTLAQMAEQVGRNPTYISAMERGLRPVQGPLVEGIIRLFEVTGRKAEYLRDLARETRYQKPNKKMTAFGQMVRTRLVYMGRTTNDLAKYLSITKGAMTNTLYGRCRVVEERAIAIADFLYLEGDTRSDLLDAAEKSFNTTNFDLYQTTRKKQLMHRMYVEQFAAITNAQAARIITILEENE